MAVLCLVLGEAPESGELQGPHRGGTDEEFYIQMDISFLFFPLPLLLLISQLLVKPPQTTSLLICILFLGDGFDHCLLYSVMSVCP